MININMEALKMSLVRFGRVFIAAFLAQLAVEFSHHTLNELVDVEHIAELLIIPCIAAGLAGISKWLRESKGITLPV